MINEDVRYLVEAELQSGEKLLWADKPLSKQIYIRPVLYLLALILFGFTFLSLLGTFIRLGVPFYSSDRKIVFILSMFTLITGYHFFLLINGWIIKSRTVFGLSEDRLFWVSKNLFNRARSSDIDRVYEAVPITKNKTGKIILKRVPEENFFSPISLGAAVFDALFSVRHLPSIRNAQAVSALINRHISLRKVP